MRDDITVVTVCVHYDDILALTLPSWKKHFENIWVITTWKDRKTQDLVNRLGGAKCFCTDIFYHRGARFNKGAALEEFFDYMPPEGWFLHLDSDIVLPEVLPIPDKLDVGKLYTVPRRNFPALKKYNPEESWDKYPWERQNLKGRRDISQVTPLGYFQLFNIADPHLKTGKPRFGRDFFHAGKYDIFFMRHWGDPRGENDFETLDFAVLHLGPVGRNWCGRVTPRLDGEAPPFSDEIKALQREIWTSTLAKGGSKYDKIRKI